MPLVESLRFCMCFGKVNIVGLMAHQMLVGPCLFLEVTCHSRATIRQWDKSR